MPSCAHAARRRRVGMVSQPAVLQARMSSGPHPPLPRVTHATTRPSSPLMNLSLLLLQFTWFMIRIVRLPASGRLRAVSTPIVTPLSTMSDRIKSSNTIE